MLLKKLKISNFRSFNNELTVIDMHDLTTIIGSNSSGKSAILHSLLKLFGSRMKDRNIDVTDFHLKKDQTIEDLESNDLYIEAIITFPELKEGNKLSELSVPPSFETMIIDREASEPYIRIRLEAKWEKGNNLEGYVEQKLWYITVKEGEPINEKSKYPANYKDISKIIQILYIPAIREPGDQLKNISGTIFHRIFKEIKWSEGKSEAIKNKIEELDSLFSEEKGIKCVQEILNGQWKFYHDDVRYSEAKISFNISEFAQILKKINIEFLPKEFAKSYCMDNLGEGLRSLFYFCLVNSLLEIEKKALEDSLGEVDEPIFLESYIPPNLTLLAIEEPENHITPQLMGKMIDQVYDISRKTNAQVILTSHSPSIIRRVDPEKICHLRVCLNHLHTVAKKISLPDKESEYYKYIKQAITAYPELYFAKFIILGEGDTEEILLPKLFETKGKPLDFYGINVVPLGGRHVNYLWKLLNDLEIPYLTLLDLDNERATGGWWRVKYICHQLREIGKDEDTLNKILGLSSGETIDSITDRKLDTREDRDKLIETIIKLEEFNIFFSYPLDLDFLMLKTFPDEYKLAIDGGRGPNIPDKEINPEEYQKRQQKDIRTTLKPQGGEGETYSDSEKDLMAWYNYLFLNRGKPTTHLLALTNIKDDDLKDKIPEPLKRLIDNVLVQLKKTEEICIISNTENNENH